MTLTYRCFTRLLGRFVPVLFATMFIALASSARGAGETLTFEGKDGPGHGKHVVLISGDEEYRSEEAMPMLAKILSQRHGFKCTVLFALDSDGTINPNNGHSLPGAEALDSADAIIILTRFRAWPEDQMKHFVDAFHRGVPIIGLRTATHAFSGIKGEYSSFNSFGKHVLGEGWVNHWGGHKHEATRGVFEPGSKDDALLRGVTDVFVTTDVYEAYPAADAKILIRGQVLKGMEPTDPPADYKKKRATDKQEQGVNDPMMPVAWSRVFKNDEGKENRILCTTMGAASDLVNESLRRMVINGVYWGLGMDVPEKADVTFVDEYNPSVYGFDGFRLGLRPADMELGKPLPAAPAREHKAKAKSPAASAPIKSVPVNLASAVFGAVTSEGASSGEPLTFKKGDHIAILGGELPDRMQHNGYLESLIYAHFPQSELVFRNLSASGDEVATWHRSQDFGSRDQWLERVKADVIFAFYGFNESFKGEAGLGDFKSDLTKFISDTKKAKYNATGAPQLVLFSPIAFEHNRDPNIPDHTAKNAVLEKYVEAMAEVAKANNVRFVDLFHPSKGLFETAQHENASLTMDGMHLTAEGDHRLAPEIFRGLFNASAPEGDLEKLREAINDKSEMWHSRYRTVDGYNVYGGRSHLAFTSMTPGKKIENFTVMQEEMVQRDVMTANRDPRIWAVAQGKDLKVEDSNLPPVEKVPTNQPGPNPDKSWPFLSGEAAIKKMSIPPHCKVNLFASEEQFPELVSPVQMAWDTKGRLWVAAWKSYPERTPTSTVGDSILIFEDTKGTGHADKCTHFIDGLNCPTGFQFYKDGILLMQAPDLWYVHDSKGGDHGDTVERVLMGMDSADSHHTTNSMVLDPGGATYLSDGVFHRTQVENYNGPERNSDGCVWRFEPRTGKMERYAAYGFANPHGRVFDYWGNDIITDATGNASYFAPAFSGHVTDGKHGKMNEFWKRPSRPCPGTAIITTKQFPDEFWGNFINCNVISFQGAYRVKVSEDGSGLKGETIPQELISSAPADDPNFRPCAVNVGPDGAIYIADWAKPEIGHMQHHMRDPNRDHEHGRIYRMVYEGRPLEKKVAIDGQPIPELLELLKRPEDHIRTLAKIELGKRDSAQVVSAVDKWAAALDKADPTYAHNLTEALWVHQWHNIVNVDLLKEVLNLPDPHARTAATRVLCYWRDRVPEAMTLLKAKAADENPRVRLEAIRAASFTQSLDAVDAALAAAKFPMDYYLSYIMHETLNELEPSWHDALTSGKPIAEGNPSGFSYLIRDLKPNELAKLGHNPLVLESTIGRGDVPDAQRNPALADLAGIRKTTPPAELLKLIDAAKDDGPRTAALAKLLPQQPAGDLKAVRPELQTLATGASDADVRRPAWAALATADGTIATVWTEASKSPAQMEDLLNGIPMIFKHDVRNEALAKVKPMLTPGAAGSDAIRIGAINAAVSTDSDQSGVFVALVNLIEKKDHLSAATHGLRTLPRSASDPEHAKSAVNALIAWAKSVPNDKRTELDYVEAIQTAENLAGTLPASDGVGLRAQLKQLRVAVFVVNTVREQMRYDTTRIVVEAGKPFEVIFQNVDFMPHNFVIVKPGTRSEVGKSTANMRPDQLDNEGRAFLPAKAKKKPYDIVAATKLVEPGQHENLKVEPLTKEGDYEFLCTFPGHWENMWGRLVVTKDLDKYLAEHPDAKLPKVQKDD